MSEAPRAKPVPGPMTAAHAAPRCGAKTRAGHPCCGPAMPNGRCRMHGGKSTGPRTLEGLERCRKAPWKHGRRSAEAIEAARLRGKARGEAAELQRLLKDLDDLEAAEREILDHD